jgi:hypothetical protein
MTTIKESSWAHLTLVHVFQAIPHTRLSVGCPCTVPSNIQDVWYVMDQLSDRRNYLVCRSSKHENIPLPDILSYPIFTPKPSTHHMHDPGSIVPHIRPKGFIDNQMSRIKYDYYYINSVSKDYDDSQWNGIAEDSITPQE